MAPNNRIRGALYLGAVLSLASGVTYVVGNMIQNIATSSTAPRAEESVKVVVAAKNIAPGWTITEDMLEERTLPANYVPPEAIKDRAEIEGRVVMERVLYGEFLREERMAPPEAGSGLAAIVPRGMRAYQVKVSGGQALSGFLNPGNFVDVIAACPAAEPPGKTTLLRSVTVLAVNDRMVDNSFDAADGKSGNKKIKPSVTLALTPADTVLIKHATEECEIYLALRNDVDVTNIESNVPGAAPAPEPAPADGADGAGAPGSAAPTEGAPTAAPPPAEAGGSPGSNAPPAPSPAPNPP
jgi:pilus assembly protein CpaB